MNLQLKVKKDHGKLEATVSKLGDVFDSVKKSADSNTKKFAKFRREVCELGQGNSQRDHQVIEDVKTLSATTASLQNSMTDLKTQSMRDKLLFSGIEEQRGKIRKRFCKPSSNENSNRKMRSCSS